MSRKGGSALTEDDVLDTVSGGDPTEIRRWVEFSLPLSKPLEGSRSEHSTAVVNPDVYEVLVGAMRRLPAGTRAIFREELARKGVFIHSGKIDEVWQSVLTGDFLGLRHWVRTLPLDDCSVDQYGRLVRPYNAEISPTLVQDLIKVNERATAAVSEFLLDELAKRGVFLPMDRPVPIVRPDKNQEPAVGATTAATAAATSQSPSVTMSGAVVQLVGPESDTAEAGRDAATFDYTRMVVRLARVGLLFRPRPFRREHAFMERIAPAGAVSPFHHFVLHYLHSFGLKAALEAYSAWYDLREVPFDLFDSGPDPTVLRGTVPMVRGLFAGGLAEEALGRALVFRPADYDPASITERGLFEYVDASAFDAAAVKYEYMTPLITRIDLRDLRPTYDRVERRLVDMAELRLALQRPFMPAPAHHLGYRVPENIQGSKSDSTLYSYVYNETGVNADATLSRSLWAVRLDESMSADEIRKRAEEQRAQAVLRDWLRHRSPVGAAHAAFTELRPSCNHVWDVMAGLAVRVAMSNYAPHGEPKYDFPPQLDEFATYAAMSRGKGGGRGRVSTADDEVVSTCMTFLDLISARDGLETATLSLYLEAIEVFSRFHPDIFGERLLVHNLDRAFASGQHLLHAVRDSYKWQRPSPPLLQLRQLPADLRKVFTALGMVYSKDTTETGEKREVLRLLTMFFMLYRVQFSDNLASTWRKLENGAPTANLVRWLLAVASVFRLTPSVFAEMVSRASNMFDGRPEVPEHLALLVGAPSGLLASPGLLKSPAGFEEDGVATEDRAGCSVWDRTSWLLHQMPSNLDSPPEAGAGITDAAYVGTAVLRRALRSVTGHAPFDAALPSLALDLGARREDAFMVSLLTHEAAYARNENKIRDADQAVQMPQAGSPPYRWRSIEETMLRLVSRRWYTVLVHGLRMFYPESAALELARGLMDLSRGKYAEFRAVMLKVVPTLQTPGAGAGSRAPSAPAGYHITGNARWTTEMAEEMMRSAFGVESDFSEPRPYDRQFLRTLFEDLKYAAGLKVLDELNSSHRGGGGKAEDYDFTSSEKLYEQKLVDFAEFTAAGSILWEYRWERQRFYAEAETEFASRSASPVVTGAFFYTLWCRFKYQERRQPFHPFEPPEELQLLFHAVRQWRRCDAAVYGEVVRTLSARMYCLMVASDLDRCDVMVSGEPVTVLRDEYFPQSHREPRPVAEEDLAIAAAASAVNAAPRRKPDFLPDASPDEIGKVELYDDVKPMQEAKPAAGVGRAAREDDAPVGDGGAAAVPSAGAGSGGASAKEEAADEDDPLAAEDMDADVAKELARIKGAARANADDADSGQVAKRLDVSGFLVYRPLSARHYMPLASQWLDRWRDEEELEREAKSRGVSLAELQRQLSARREEQEQAKPSVPMPGTDGDPREMDVNLFVEVMDRLLYHGQYQLAYGLANDVLEYYPKLFDKTLPELRDHMNRIRLVFFVAGIMNLRFSDLGLALAGAAAGAGPGAGPAGGAAAAAGAGAPAGSDVRKPRFVSAWRANKPISKAANFANIRWLPDDLQSQYVVVARRRVGWYSETKVNPIRYLLVKLFPRINPMDVRDHMRQDKREQDVKGRVAIMGEFKRHDEELGRVCDLFISALLIHHKEVQRGFSQRSVAETVASLVERANDGSLPLMMAVARACGDTSVVSLIQMEPAQVIYELLHSVQDFTLIKQFLRVTSGGASASASAARQAASSRDVVTSLALAYEEWLERRVGSDLSELQRANQEAQDAALRLSGREWADAMARANEEHERRQVRMLDEGWSRNRLIAYVGCAGERRQLDVLGDVFLGLGLRVDMTSAPAGASGAASVEGLRILRFELLYAAYFAYFAASHLRGMRSVLAEIDKSLASLQDKPLPFRMFVQRTLFLTGEYKSLPQSLGKAVQQQSGADERARARQEAVARLEAKRAELRRVRKLRAEEEGRGGGAADAPAEGGPAGQEDAEADAEAEEDGMGLGEDQLSALKEAAKDDAEVEMSSRRYALVVGLLDVIKTLRGYELFQELERISAAFKDLAWHYQSLGSWKQSLDCHRIGELIQVEMEYIPDRLARFNFVNPDEHEFHQLWKNYSAVVPRKQAEERQREAAAKDAAAGGASAAGRSRSGGTGTGTGGTGAGDYFDDEAGDGDDADADAVRNPDLMAPSQLELLVADCILSGVQGRYLERVRRDFAVEARQMQAQGKMPGRVYKELHNLIQRTAEHFVQECGGDPITKDELRRLIMCRGEEMLEFDPSRKHVFQESSDVDSRKYPSTVLFLSCDKYGRWNLGVDASNEFAAQQTLRVMNNLHRYKQAELFKDFYFQ